MMRILGFLAGMWLTAAAFLLVLDFREAPPPELATEASSAQTTEPTPSPPAADPEEAPHGASDGDATASAIAAADLTAVPLTNGPSIPDPTAGPSQPPLGEDRADIAEAGPPPAPTARDQVAAQASLYPPDGPSMDPLSAFPAPPVEPPETEALASSTEASHRFWSPFRSEWAARGFAGRLTSATQVPVEVIEAGPGKYRVAFRYQDETERLARIQRIETVTGLKLEE
jgi:hypothetical protein